MQALEATFPAIMCSQKKETYFKVPSRVCKQVVKVSSHFDSFVSDEKSLLMNVWLTRAYWAAVDRFDLKENTN